MVNVILQKLIKEQLIKNNSGIVHISETGDTWYMPDIPELGASIRKVRSGVLSPDMTDEVGYIQQIRRLRHLVKNRVITLRQAIRMFLK